MSQAVAVRFCFFIAQDHIQYVNSVCVQTSISEKKNVPRTTSNNILAKLLNFLMIFKFQAITRVNDKL